MSLQERLALNTDLNCAVAHHFSLRPTLFEVCARLLEEQWSTRKISHHDPRLLYLVSLDSTPERTYVRPLQQALAERFCRHATLNLTTAEDFLSLKEDADPHSAIDIDLHAIEQLINESGPFLLEYYQHALVAFWGEADRSGLTPWQWYTDYLRQNFKSAIDTGFDAGTLSQTAAAMARLIYSYPTPQERSAWPNASKLDLQQLELDTSASAYLDADLASALLLEHPDSSPQRSVTLIYTTSGQLVPIASRQALFDGLGRLWPDRSAVRPKLHLTHTPSNNFETQAQGVLNQQLRTIRVLAQQYQSEYSAALMSLELDRLSSMIDLCSAAEQKARKQLFEHLPDWLRNAKGALMRRYGAMLLDAAQSYDDAAGQFWLDGIDDAETFSYQKLERQIEIDHPGNNLAVRDMVVINHQVEAAAIPGQDSLIVDGTVHPVRFSLARLAIGNLSLLQPGRVELVSASGQALPTWMDENYLRQLISKLDIGTSYPQMLTHNMLDDSDQRQLRQRLFDAQLRTQIPAFALELHLRDKSLSDAAASGISQAFQTLPSPTPDAWVIRPMGLIREPGATSDLLHNAWLIEAEDPATSPCVLYRPMHAQPLLEFSDRLALFVAISSPGELQDDLLQRLPEQSRRIYAHGGFLEPHLYRSVEDDFTVPFGTPAPARLSLEARLPDIGASLYQACVEETIQHFKAQSASTAATRWKRWQALGWLLFNTLLPLTGSVLAKAAWLVQMSVALAAYVNADTQNDPTGKRIALINLLVNVAVLLFSQSYQGLSLDTPVVELLPDIPSAPSSTPLIPVQASETPLDFSWARPDHTLKTMQRVALEKLQANVALSQLHSPIPSGPLRGLFLYNDQLWARLDNQIYRVEMDPMREQPRIVGGDDADAPGPWLTRDEAGRWQFDLALRLRAGMPLRKQLAHAAQQAAQANSALKAKLVVSLKQLKDGKAERDLALDLAARITETNHLRQVLTKTQGYAQFFTELLRMLEESNEITPFPDYKIVRPTALYELIRCEQSSYGSLKKLFLPLRAQMLELSGQQVASEALSGADNGSARERLDTMGSMLEQLITATQSMTQARKQLNRLASRQQEQITKLNDWVQANQESTSEHLMWRFLRVENNFNRLSLLYSLDDPATYWLDRAWKNLNLGIAQQLRLADLEQPAIELSVRLLRSIEDQFSATLRQLDNLKSLLQEPTMQPVLTQLHSHVQQMADSVHQDLAEFPDYPPTSTVKQLRSQVPGLIETTGHGLLLAEPRAGDDTLVDIPGPDNKTPSRTFRHTQEDWVEVPSSPRPAPAQSTSPSLKRLLKRGRIRLANAHAVLLSLQKADSASYLPVEIEELLEHQQSQLEAERGAIEQRLTIANQTDEAVSTEDAALTIKSLDELTQTLKTQALKLRTQAALVQKPRMAEVQYLIDHGQVQVRAAGPRTQLAKVKGRADDFLDEYEIRHQNEGLWYAHFHYPAMDTPRESFIVGHLKTAAQRHAAGTSMTDARTGKLVDIYRAPITLASAERYFFNL
ncbi:DUF6543 domain-containing protein [Pseudomonas sp. BBP2017]|uniref:DUF6543 domain-containing protein n=1 Tax=Pseudomonas sp. BBP2017 TaxID=2109731 RepID=UPI000D117C78|nr:DUF6543 domain-containing protein [Pseudomonas sp. BBP2017]PSS52729.1 hypothetical protein C6382_16205 [Pseudomonas sp. BBP2017]